MGLEAAVEATVQFLNKAVKPVLVGGPKLRVAKAQKAFVDLVDAPLGVLFMIILIQINQNYYMNSH